MIVVAVFEPLAKDLEMGVASSFRELWKPDLDWHRSFQLFRVPSSVSKSCAILISGRTYLDSDK